MTQKFISIYGRYKGINYEIKQFEMPATSFMGKYSHCAYLMLAQDMNPAAFTTPGITTYGLGHSWAYDEIPLARLDWHGGVTFYEQTINALDGRVRIKIGCDYQHYGDQCYSECDNLDVIEKETHQLINQLLEMFPDTAQTEE